MKKDENLANIGRGTNSRKGISAVLVVLVAAVLGTAIISGLYVSGVVGNHNTGNQTSGITMQIPGGQLVARNVTESICGFSSTSSNSTSSTSNSTTTACLPVGFG